MPFRFFRPWEDSGQSNTRQTPDSLHEALTKSLKTTTPPQVLSAHAELQSDRSEKATRSAQILSDIPGPLCQEKEAYRTERKDVRNVLQRAVLSTQKLLSQDRVLRQTSASASNGNGGSVGINSDCSNKDAEIFSWNGLNHIQKSPSQTDKLCSEAKKTPSSIVSKHLTSSVALQYDSSLQVTSENVSWVYGNTLCNRDSLVCLSTFVAEDDDFHNKVTLDLSAFTKDASEMNHSRVIEHSSMLEKQQQYSLSTPPKDECCVETLSDGSSTEKQTCRNGFSSSSIMHWHKKIHTKSKPFQCTLCDKTFSSLNSLQTHKRTHTGCRPHQCPAFDKGFSNLSNLHVHKGIHTGSKPFQCSVCEKTFTQSGSLHRHERIHTGSKPFQCSVCEKVFTQSGSLHRHERIHTGSKPFSCNVCAKAFTSCTYLSIHERIHTGSKPFKCSVCEKAFKQSGELHVHERSHTGSRPFKCSVCKKAFKRSGDLHVHERIHTGSKPFHCSVCEKAFKQSCNLHRHERIHTRSKPFKCSICEKAFTTSGSLHVHERIHTGSKPFKCSICKKAFKQSCNLHRHERIHTGSRPLK